MQCTVCHGSGISPGTWQFGGRACGACHGSGWLPDNDDADTEDEEDEDVGAAEDDEDEPAAADAPAGEGALFKSLFGTLKREIDKDRRAGKVTTERRLSVDGAKEALEGLVRNAGTDRPLEAMLRERDSLNGVMSAFLPSLRNPSLGGSGPKSGSRAAGVIARLQEAKTTIAADALRLARPKGEAELTQRLFLRYAKLTAALHAAGNDATKSRHLERDEARALMLETRWYLRRHHATLAEPIWSRDQVAVDANLVFCQGGTALSRHLAPLAEQRGLTLARASEPGADWAAAHARALQAAGLAAFDLSSPDPQLYYDLGIALTLGTELLLVARRDVKLPFDVAQDVLRYDDDAAPARALPKALDDALYNLKPVRATESGLARTVARVAELAAAAPPTPFVDVMLKQVQAAANDPIELRGAIAGLQPYLGPNPPPLLYPRWPGHYPEAGNRRCFVVMPFRRHLDGAWQAIAAGCEDAGVAGVRGDIAPGQEIIESIWQEIGKASCIVVDLTDLNPNVCLELGMADALGRPTLLIGRKGTDRARLPSIATRRFHGYAPDDATALRALVRGFARAGAPKTPARPLAHLLGPDFLRLTPHDPLGLLAGTPFGKPKSEK